MQKTPPNAPPTQPLALTPADWALLCLHSTLWGSSYFFIAVAKTEIAPWTMTSLRMLPALLVVVPVMWAWGQRLPRRLVDWLPFTPMVVTNTGLPFVLTIEAQKEVTGGMAAVICATTPLFALFIAHAVTHDEKITANKIAGLVVGITGVGVLAMPDLIAGSGASLMAKGLLLCVALLYATGSIYARRALAGTPSMTITVAQMVVTVALTLPIALIVEQPWNATAPSAMAAGAVALSGIMASGLASICYFTLIKRAGATNALLVTLLLPLTPIFLGWIFLGEIMTPRDWGGAFIIALALIIIDGRLIRRIWR